MRRLAKAGAGLLAVVVVVALVSVVLAYANMDTVRAAVTSRLATLTGRAVEIAGGFSIAPSLTPVVTAAGVSVANAPWGSRPNMLTADGILVEIRLLPLLLDREVRIDRLEINGAEIFLETGPRGTLNWDLSRQQAAEGAPPRRDRALAISDVTVRDSTLAWPSGNGATETVALNRLDWRAEERKGGAVLNAAGRYEELPFTIEAGLDTAASIGFPVPVEAHIEYGSTVLSIERAARKDGAHYHVGLTGSDSSVPSRMLARVLDRQIPELGPWSLKADVAFAEDTVAVSGFQLRAGSEGGHVIAIQNGAVAQLIEGEGLSLPVSVEGPSLASAGELLGLELPEIGSYEATGRITGSFESPSLEDLVASVGRSETAQIRIADGSVENLRSGEGLRLPVEARGQRLSVPAGYAGWQTAFGPWSARGTLAGSIDAPALQRLQAQTSRDGATIGFAGMIADLRTLSGLDLRMSGEGPTLETLSSLIGSALPASGPFRISADIGGGAEELVLDDVSARLGDTRVDGGFRIERANRPVPRIEGRLSAQHIDVDALWSMARQSGEESGVGGAGPLELGWLSRVDAELAVQARTIAAQGRSFSNARAKVLLQDGQLALRDLTARVAGGAVTADARIDSGANSMAEVTLRMNVEDLHVAEVLAGDLPGRVKGVLDVDLHIDARGQTLDALAASLEGEAAVFAEEGRLDDVPLNRLIPDLDIARILPFVGRRDSTVRINCLIGEFDLDSGVAQADTMLDTRRMTVFGRGAVDLGEGTLDFSLRPVAKSRKLSQSAVPVDIEGDLADPEIRPRKGAAVGGAVRGILGGLLVPLNQLTGLFGQEAKSACTPALQQARERSKAMKDSK